MLVKFMHRLEHISPWLQAIVILIMEMVIPPPDEVSGAWGVVLAGIIGISSVFGILMITHRLYPCEACTVRRRGYPREAVEKYRLVLRIWHATCRSLKAAIVTCLSLLVGPVLSILLPGVRIGMTVMLVQIVALWWINWIHWNLEHVCPECQEALSQAVVDTLDELGRRSHPGDRSDIPEDPSV